MVPFPCLTQQGRDDYGLSPTERPCGTSAAEGAPCACLATATVLQACAGDGEGHAELPGDLGGAERRCAAGCLLSAATGGSAAAEDASAGGPGCHRRREPAKRACSALDKSKVQCSIEPKRHW